MKWRRDHPATLLQEFLLESSNESLAHLSIYSYVQARVSESRRVFKVPARALRPFVAWLSPRLRRDTDLAVHSTFQLAPGKADVHLAFVDLAAPLSDPRIDQLLALMKNRWGMKSVLARSGRSGHIYGLRALSTLDWLEYMAELLQLSEATGLAAPINPHTVAAFLKRSIASVDTLSRDSVLSFREQEICQMFNRLPQAPPPMTWSSGSVSEPLALAIRVAAEGLLLNPPNASEVVDTRWVAHRLLGGYGALRWTCNQRRYLGEPTVVRVV